MKIIVIGAGVVGLATAWRLSLAGHEVTVVDSAASAGAGTSFANGAQLSYSYVAPLADPSVWGQLPKLLTDPDSPVQFRPGADLFQYRWLLQFLAACNQRQAHATIDRLGMIADLSKHILHDSEELRTADFCWTRTGKLVVYSSEKSFASARQHAEYQAQGGVDKRAVGREECLAIEPALASIGHRIVGGLFSPGDEAGDALMLCREFERLLSQAERPATFLYDTTVTRLVREKGVLRGLDTSRGHLEADLYVLAAGVQARALGRTAGLDLPIYPIKGYSLSVPVAAPAAAPTVSITDAMRKVVLARLGETLRIAGAADLVGENLSIDTRRVGKLLADARSDFPDAADWSNPVLWSGLRPATPTGQPMIGESGVERLLLNVGHGALGFTLALGSAELLAREI
ncbi:D-amino acid dehydrogenase [Devosia albogilva]|uniref:D-amino acid dehydrogenase n=1 Tax=Devosia albogilva TaxID=429726 RepID=A0ABW5QF74_9HYPH